MISVKKNVGIIKQDDEVLVISNDGVQNKEWIEITYPTNGFVYSEDLAVTPSNHVLGIGISYGALNIPYEKNLKNYKKSYWWIYRIHKSNWDFLFRLGYSNGQSNLNEVYTKK